MEFEFDDDQFELALLNIDMPASKQVHTHKCSCIDAKLARSLIQGSDAWFAARKNRLTASNFATAAGLSKYVTPTTLWEKLTGRIPNEQISTAETRHGTENEDVARKFYERLMRTKVEETGLWLHPQYAWLAASPDGLIDSDGLLEIKCPIYQVHEQVPMHYMAQVQGQIECCDRKYCDFLSWRAGCQRVIRVYRSKAYWAWLQRILQTFWDCVEKNQNPRSRCPMPPVPPPPPVFTRVLFCSARPKARCTAIITRTGRRCKRFRKKGAIFLPPANFVQDAPSRFLCFMHKCGTSSTTSRVERVIRSIDTS